MKETVTGHTVANTAMMLRTAQPAARPVLLVEGRSDCKMLEHCLGTRVEILPSWGKAHVFDAVKVLDEERGQRGWYFAIVDADFDRLLGFAWDHAAVAMTDLHDLECEYVHSPALEKVLREYGAKEKLARRFGGSADNLDWRVIAERVRADLHRAGIFFGALRLVSERLNLGLDFQKVNHASALNPKTIEVDPKKLVDMVLMKNSGKGVDRRGLRQLLNSEIACGHDPWQACQGHDLVTLFAIAMRRVWCSSAPSEEVLEKSLRIGFEAAYFFRSGHGARVQQFLEQYEKAPELKLGSSSGKEGISEGLARAKVQDAPDEKKNDVAK